MNARSKKKKKSAGTAVWVPVPGNMLHVSCSACGFEIETVRAVETGWTSSDHVRVKYNFCPSCGRRMGTYRAGPT